MSSFSFRKIWKEFNRVNVTFLITGAIIGVIALHLFVSNAGDFSGIQPKKFGPVDEKKARPNLEVYRDDLAYTSLAYYRKAKVKGIIYDTADFVGYFSTHFQKFTANHPTIDPNKYCWQIGVYPMVCRDTFEGKDRPRIGIYFIPTMVNKTNSTDILDFMSLDPKTINRIYRKQTLSTFGDPPGSSKDSFIYDEGHLWP